MVNLKCLSELYSTVVSFLSVAFFVFCSEFLLLVVALCLLPDVKFLDLTLLVEGIQFSNPYRRRVSLMMMSYSGFEVGVLPFIQAQERESVLKPRILVCLH